MRLLRYILKRLFLMLIVMFGVTVIVFVISHVIPADPVGMILGDRVPTEQIEDMRRRLGLDKPIHKQFIDYMYGILHGDFGVSIITNKPVMEDIVTFFPATLELALFSIFFSIVTGIILGVLSAVHRNSLIDHFSRVFSIIGVSMPIFWIGLLLLLLFYFKLEWLPSGGRNSLFIIPEHITGLVLLDSLITNDWSAFWDGLKHIILPSAVLGYSSMASITRIMRASMLEVLKIDYIRTARSKGLPKFIVVYRHALRNALIPVVTVIGIRFGGLLGGAVLTETIFSWPGLGRYLVKALLVLDYPAVTGGTLIIALIYSIANLIVDISYFALDPRM